MQKMTLQIVSYKSVFGGMSENFPLFDDTSGRKTTGTIERKNDRKQFMDLNKSLLIV